jgi:hypothetical protein
MIPAVIVGLLEKIRIFLAEKILGRGHVTSSNFIIVG